MNKNAYLDHLRAQKAAELHHARKFAIRFTMDAFTLALNEVFGFGEDRLNQLSPVVNACLAEMTEIIYGDMADKDLEYAKTAIDRRLAGICGDSFRPWDERFDI